jgi:protoporphyrinogen oxidase
MTVAAAPRVAIIGGGFCGLTAAYSLATRGVPVTVLEESDSVGGLAGSFEVNGQPLEKFYHHWFTSDLHVNELIASVGDPDRLVRRASRTGMYYANQFFRLSSPLDLLRFTPLRLHDRFRLGLLALRARRVEDWRALEQLTAAEWLRSLGGQRVYEVVWEPLLKGKFGEFADEISAVWFWNKLKLRGSSRGKRGAEELAYYRGGFATLAGQLVAAIRRHGGEVRTGARVKGLHVRDGRVQALQIEDGQVIADLVIATPALPLIADLLAPHVTADYAAKLRRIKYLANLCLVLELDRSLSETYWLNVNDPRFPFVGVIEHTNLEPAGTYGGRHIAYLSKYLPESAPLFQLGDQELLEFSIPHLQRMFPAFRREWIVAHHVWRAQYSQPIVERRYGALIPPRETPLANLLIATMAQIYPEDRGTNYAIREGQAVATAALARLQLGAGS